ncbi:class I SAM-dependent methyltransferase [Candidatus Woesearchaeota archaeon]|nr:class I SAM-dependent methyltransferase [Candidatus Woesearchaeota archaeon]
MQNTKAIKDSIKHSELSHNPIFTEDHALDEFDEKLNLLNKETDINKQLLIVRQMQEIAKNVSALRGWPYNAKVFWGKEAVFWKQRIGQKYRVFIKNELTTAVNKNKLDKNKLDKNKLDKNKLDSGSTILELGTGNIPCIKNAVCLDLSHEMLATIGLPNMGNKTTIKRVQANVEYSLPIRDNCIDTIVALFLCNYIERLDIMLGECKRVLKENGQIIIVQSAAAVDNYHSLLERHPAKELTLILKTILQELGFKAQIDVKDVDKKTLVFIAATNS